MHSSEGHRHHVNTSSAIAIVICWWFSFGVWKNLVTCGIVQGQACLFRQPKTLSYDPFQGITRSQIASFVHNTHNPHTHAHTHVKTHSYTDKLGPVSVERNLSQSTDGIVPQQYCWVEVVLGQQGFKSEGSGFESWDGCLMHSREEVSILEKPWRKFDLGLLDKHFPKIFRKELITERRVRN